MSSVHSILLALMMTAAHLTLAQDATVLRATGTVRFVSNAPLERIEAGADGLTGLLDTAASTFAFTLPVGEFVGFNSPLQQEHFHEHYMESERYPAATFTGKIIERFDLSSTDWQDVRAKGDLTLHGMTVQRILPVRLRRTPQGIEATSDFGVPNADHGIHIPKIVQRKIAEVIDVHVELRFTTEP